jgi:RNA polymerase sigma factor (sigma-70 family)
MSVHVLRLEDALKQGLHEGDLVRGRSPVPASETLPLSVPAFEGPPGTKCIHGVYRPYGEKTALYCSICNPYILEVPKALHGALKPVPDDQEASLTQLVESGTLSEAMALKQLETRSTFQPKYVRALNTAYEQYRTQGISGDLFYQSLLKYVEKLVKRQSLDRSTFSNLEDVITDSVLKVWQRLEDFDSRKSSFVTFVTLITLSQIRTLLSKYKTDRGDMEHIQLDEATIKPASGLSAEQKALFQEWLKSLEPTDRALVQMLQDGLKQEEIGQALNMTQQAVAWRLRRIRREELAPF